ncbi:uncharacterized protein [Atheta coriaria]|uniref:uncharacterized protein n=1 Tax=Dalotia coriaria TaxID=877792 RepID=UPI0031F342C3
MNVDGSFTGIMKKLKIDPENLKVAMRNFDISTSNEPSTITPIPAVLEDFEELKSVATQISEFKAVTHKDAAILKKFREIAPSATLFGTNLSDDRKIEVIPNTLNPTDANYATLWSENTMGSRFTELALTDEIQGRKEYSNCYYWYVDDQFATQYEVTPVLEKYVFDVKKAHAEDVLMDGTPLVCDGKLYALTVNDMAGKSDAVFVSKYPIMREEEGSSGFFGSIINMVTKVFKGMFKGVTDIILMPYRFVKKIFSSFFK